MTVVMGHFKRKVTKCRVCNREFETHEEKETDVNIGIHVVADALLNRFDRALIISADTDLNPVVSLLRREVKGKFIDIVAPPGRMSRNSSALFAITNGKIATSQLPDSLVVHQDKVLYRPDEYQRPVLL